MAGKWALPSAAGMHAQQRGMQAAIEAGTLWMDEGVAERAARRCDQEVDRVDELLFRRHRLTEKLPFGDNADGNACSERFAAAGVEYLTRWREYRAVVVNMAQTYRDAGAAAAAAEEASAASMRGLQT